MKKLFTLSIGLLFIASVGLNVWQASIRKPLPPVAGSGLNDLPERPIDNRTSFRIATYNIKRCYGLDGVGDCRRTAQALKGFDIVALNEVGGGEWYSWFSRSNQAETLGSLLDVGWLFLPNQERYYQEHFGNGLLSTLPVTGWYREQLLYDKEKGGPHRNLTTIQFHIGTKSFVVMLTHLDLLDNHEAQLAYVIDKFSLYDRCIMLGDLNTTAKDPQLRNLFEEGRGVDAIQAALGLKDFPRADWIITKGFRVTGGGTTPRGISDHPLFWVELEFE